MVSVALARASVDMLTGVLIESDRVLRLLQVREGVDDGRLGRVVKLPFADMLPDIVLYEGASVCLAPVALNPSNRLATGLADVFKLDEPFVDIAPTNETFSVMT